MDALCRPEIDFFDILPVAGEQHPPASPEKLAGSAMRDRLDVAQFPEPVKKVDLFDIK